MAKYSSQRSEVGELTFASRKEAERYIYLRSCFEAGEIENLMAHKQDLRFDISPAVRLPVTLARPARLAKRNVGKLRKVRRVYYETDFRYTIYISGFPFHIWEDVKALPKPKPNTKPKPLIDSKSTVKMNIFRAMNADDKSIVLRICTNITAHPLDIDDYWY